jgi:hypothetical protein
MLMPIHGPWRTDFVAKINWGDGTAPSTGTIQRDPSSPSPTAFIVTGSHTYQHPGTYPVVVDLTASKGQRATARGMAVVTAGPVHAFGRTFKTTGAYFDRRSRGRLHRRLPAARYRLLCPYPVG